MNVDQKKLVLFDVLLSGGGLSQLVDAAAAVLGNPVAIIDLGMAMIEVSSQLANDPVWSRTVHEETARDLRSATLRGDFRRVYQSDQTVLGDYPGADQRYLAARIRRGQTIFGHALVLERNHPFTPEDQRLLPDVCRTFGYMLAPQANSDALMARYGSLLSDLLDGHLLDDGTILARTRQARLHTPSRMRAIVLRPLSDTEGVPARNLLGKLLTALPSSFGIVREEDVILVVDDERPDVESTLAAHAFLEAVCVGVSYPFDQLSGLRTAYRQADAAIRLSANTTPAAGIVHYEEVVAAHLFESATTQDSAEFEHPAIALLAHADASDHSDYLSDLEAYLLNGRNAAATARALHVHKNTMYYRLQRIQEIAHVDLSDEVTCFALQLSIAIHKPMHR